LFSFRQRRRRSTGTRGNGSRFLLRAAQDGAARPASRSAYLSPGSQIRLAWGIIWFCLACW
jgi:hypothetical protein